MNREITKAASGNRQDLDRLLDQRGMSGLWTVDPSERPPEPRTRVRPHLWKWDEVYDGLLRSREQIPIARGSSERRAIRLVNPGLRETKRTTHTMIFTAQIINPGEIAPPHRHSMAAIRFILKGKGAYTNVQGEKMMMEEGDLILTPQGTWHEHANEGSEPMVWIDGLDVPLIESLQLVSMEPYGDERLAVDNTRYSSTDFGMMRPVAPPRGEVPRPFHYPWKDIYPSLKRRAELDPHPYEGVALEYANPTTGGATLPTLACWLQLLRPGERTQVHRHTSTTIYHAFRGSGTTVVNGDAIHWEQGDTFVVPLWHWHEHANRTSTEEAVLFSMHDKPVLEAFGLYREEGQGPTRMGL
ncbi:MAG TPA: cupin domain-containing protein [Candidatus Binatia bacterium]